MKVRGLTPSILNLILMLGVALPLAHSEDHPNASSPIDPLYREVLGGMYFDAIPPNTGPALTVELGRAGRLILPPRFAEQEVFEVKRVFYLGPGLEDAVVVGLHASVPDGPSQAFALVYGGSGQQRVLKVELPLRQYYLGCEVLTLGREAVLAIHGASGAHFDDLWLYRFTTGAPELLLAQGSAAGAEIRMDAKTGNPQVWVGVENWSDPTWNYASGERLWNVYTWNGREFAFDPQLSTAAPSQTAQRTDGYVHRVKEHLERLKPDRS